METPFASKFIDLEIYLVMLEDMNRSGVYVWAEDEPSSSHLAIAKEHNL